MKIELDLSNFISPMNDNNFEDYFEYECDDYGLRSYYDKNYSYHRLYGPAVIFHEDEEDSKYYINNICYMVSELKYDEFDDLVVQIDINSGINLLIQMGYEEVIKTNIKRLREEAYLSRKKVQIALFEWPVYINIMNMPNWFIDELFK